MKQKQLLTFFCSLLFSQFLFAQTWDGSEGTNWNTPENWNTNAVPLATGNVTIPGSLTNYPVLPANITVNNFSMDPGSSINFNGFSISAGGSTFDINGATLNNTGAGSIVLNISGGSSKYFRSNIVNDDIVINYSGTSGF